jgi:hypothetical protein
MVSDDTGMAGRGAGKVADGTVSGSSCALLLTCPWTSVSSSAK